MGISPMPKGFYSSPIRGRYERTPEHRARMSERYRARSHGQVGTGAYSSWQAMRARCLNPNNREYLRYGGRGITVCERWQSFENFLADMGLRPEGLTLDRINPDGNYEPGNCRWATWTEQRVNQRRMKVAV